MGHLYAELAGVYGNRGEYLDKAIEHYKQALRADPNESLLAEALSNAYIQAGRLNLAVSEAEARLKKDPNALDARRILGRIYAGLIGDRQTNKVDEGMLSKAIEQYQRIVGIDPKDLDSWLMLGRLHRVAQNSKESEKAYQKALEIDSSSQEAMTGLALAYSDAGDNKRAIEMLQRVADKHPNLRTLTSLAAAHEQMRDYAGAAEVLRRALEIAPKNLELKRALAQDLLLSNQLDAGLEIYEQVVTADPKDVQSYLQLSQLHRQKRDFKKAREAANRAKQLQPQNLDVRYNEVNLFEAEGKASEAIALMEEILDSTAKESYSRSERINRVVLLERLALLYRSGEQYTEAAEAFRMMTKLDPDTGPRAAAQVIDTYRQAKELTRAVEEAEEAHRKYPKDRMVALIRASLMADLGKAKQAVAETKKLLDGKSDRDTYLALAQVYEKTKNYKEMSKALDAAEKLSQSKQEKESVYFMRGAMYERMKNYEPAEAEFRKVLEINPANASALNYLGYMLADLGIRLEEAYDLISRAIELEPNNGAFLDSLGWVYYRMDKLDEAETYLRRSLERVSRDPTVRDHLGDVLARRGKLKEAITQWQISLKEWESNPLSEKDPTEVAKITKKLEGARIRLAKESSGLVTKEQ
jgi:tetratricopeptide (TPR) repeat protein